MKLVFEKKNPAEQHSRQGAASWLVTLSMLIIAPMSIWGVANYLPPEDEGLALANFDDDGDRGERERDRPREGDRREGDRRRR